MVHLAVVRTEEAMAAEGMLLLVKAWAEVRCRPMGARRRGKSSCVVTGGKGFGLRLLAGKKAVGW